MNLKLRQKLVRLAREKGSHFLYERLKRINAQRAAELHPNDERRIIRALEIAESSEKNTSPSPFPLAELGFSVRVFGIERDRAELYERINERVEAMFRKGFLKEVQRLGKKGFSKTARQALGYREILHWLSNGRGEVSSPSNRGRGNPAPTGLIELIQKNTRRFAKRQGTWFRREKRIEWISWKRGESLRGVCDKISREAKKWLENAPFS